MSFASELESRAASIEQQTELLETCADPATRAAALELVRSVMELHKAALERMLALLGQEGEPARKIIERWAGDPLVNSVLMLHDLHPRELTVRVVDALEKLRPMLERHRAEATLTGIMDGVVRVALTAPPQCGSTMVTLKSSIEQALIDAAPDVEIVVETPAQTGSSFISVDALSNAGDLQQQLGPE